MSLSTQLNRGNLALPMLLLFALLALAGNEEVGAQPPVDHASISLVRTLEPGSICAANLPRRGLLLGRAPADLAPIATPSCRA